MMRTNERTLVARMGGLRFRILVPADWIEEEIPSSTHDFDNSTTLAPLTTGHDASNTITLSADARPSSESMPLKKRAYALQEAHGLNVYSMDEQDIGSFVGVCGVATDAMSDNTVGIRFAFLEVSEHIVRVTLNAPHAFPGVPLSIWTRALKSFALLDAQGIAMEDTPVVDDWWARAQQLEQNNQFDEAEAVIAHAVPHIGSGAQTARLYADRMERLVAQGDRAGAAEAHEKAVDWIRQYASWATSGGEGAALSLERDEFLSKLGRVP